jgi:dolichol-phosphate mannosyltransferase
VLDGFCAAQYDVLLVMDADLSHPPEKIPELLDALTEGADFVIGSRYVGGGATDEDWGILRQINSRAATWLARPFTRACDPMSGFFALRRSTLESGAALNPVGYKIGLEVLVKCACRKVVEIPIHFSQRRLGESKLSFKEQLRYLQHLRRLAVFKYGDWAHFLQFALVGASGVIVNLAALTLLIWAYLPTRVAGAVAIFIAMVSNFALNRYITFSYARHAPVLPQLVGFMGACSLGALANYGVFLGALHVWPALVGFPQPAALLGILAGTVINYVMSRYFVFQTPKA